MLRSKTYETGRGDTINEPMLTVRLSSPAPDIIRVQLTHFKGKGKQGTVFRHKRMRAAFNVDICEDEDFGTLTSGKLSVKDTEKEWLGN